MSVIGGISGAVEQDSTPISAVGRWSVTHPADLQPVVNSATDGAEVTLDGNKDWSGSYEAFGHTPAVQPGDGFTFHGSFDGTNGCNGVCVVDSVEIVFDTEAGAAIKHTVNFSANGDLTIGADAALDDATPIQPESSIGTRITLSTVLAIPSHVVQNDIRTITLTISVTNSAYNSSTGAGVTRRVVGPLSCELTYSVYADDASTLPQVNDVKIVRVNKVGVFTWELYAMRVSELADIGANIEEGSPVEVNLTLKWSGYADEEGTFTKGYIQAPGAVDWWP